jgi:hypothetical protein
MISPSFPFHVLVSYPITITCLSSYPITTITSHITYIMLTLPLWDLQSHTTYQVLFVHSLIIYTTTKSTIFDCPLSCSLSLKVITHLIYILSIPPPSTLSYYSITISYRTSLEPYLWLKSSSMAMPLVPNSHPFEPYLWLNNGPDGP